MRLLRRLWPGPARLDVHVVAAERCLVLTPQCLHGLDVLAEKFSPLAVCGSVLRHLFLVPAVADAEEHASAAE